MRVVIIAVRLSTSLHRLFVFFLLSDSKCDSAVRKAADSRSAVRAVNFCASHMVLFFFVLVFFGEKMALLLKCISSKKKRKKRRRGAVQEEGNGGRGTHACYGVDGKFNVTAAVADLSEGSRLSLLADEGS